jgi:hypothetical protein
MKKIATIIALLFVFAANAQVGPAPVKDSTFSTIDSSVIKVTYTLRADQQLLIFDCLEQKTPQALSFASQIAKGIDTVYSASKPVTVTIESAFIKDLYFIMSTQQERFASGIIDDIKAALIPQLTSYTWLTRELQAIIRNNSGVRQQRIQRAFSTIKQMKIS